MSDQHGERGVIFSQSSPARSETTIQESVILHIWTINNFSLFLKEKEQCMRSETFSSAQNAADTNKWYLILHTNDTGPVGGNTQLSTHMFVGSTASSLNTVNQSSNFLMVYLLLVSSNDSQVSVKYKISIINDKEESVTRVLGAEVVKVGGAITKWERFIGKDELTNKKNELLPGDTLTLSCEVTTVIRTTGAFVGECATSRISECRIHHDLGCLWTNQEFSDVILVGSNGSELPAHKAILGARSSVFAAMFKNEMTENRQNKVDIVDIENDVLKEMLRFIYTGKAQNLDKISEELLVAADKYELEGLQNLCVEALSRCMTVEKVADLLVLADMHQMKDLKLKVITFILGHFEEVKKTKGWMLMTKSHPQLIMESFLYKPGGKP